MRKLSILLLFIFLSYTVSAQDYGDFPIINKDSLLLDFELLKQGLEKYHTGLYWYTPKDSFDLKFSTVKAKIDHNMNAVEFYKIIAPIVSYTKEDHTNLYLPSKIKKLMIKEAKFLPLTVKFLGTKLYCIENRSKTNDSIEYKKIESINGETPEEIVSKLGSLYANDGNIKPVEYTDLDGFDFSKYYYLYYGNVTHFKIKFKGIEEPIVLPPFSIKNINKNLGKKYHIKTYETKSTYTPLNFKIISDSIAYLGIHTFDNNEIKESSEYKTLKKFLNQSFKTISDKKIETLIIDISENGGGSEGNESLLYSYIGENYQKYSAVKAKAQKTVLDNNVDKPIKFKTYDFLEKLFTTKKMPDGSIERRNNMFGFGLMAYKKEPKYKFEGQDIYVIISPITYSGGSEFANMTYSQSLATFVGQEAGGSYYGNTSGYTQTLILLHSKIEVDIPALQFKMNVTKKIPLGRGVIPDYEVIPTIQQYKLEENAPLNYTLNNLIPKQ